MAASSSPPHTTPPVFPFAAGAWAYLIFGLVATVVGPTLQPIRETFDVGLAQVGLLFPFASLGYIGSGLLGSIASDRYARRPFVVAGSALMAAGVGIQSTAPTWSLLLAGTLVIGMGMGLLDGPLNALIMDLSTSDTAKWLNYLHFFFGTGALAGTYSRRCSPRPGGRLAANLRCAWNRGRHRRNSVRADADSSAPAPCASSAWVGWSDRTAAADHPHDDRAGVLRRG